MNHEGTKGEKMNEPTKEQRLWNLVAEVLPPAFLEDMANGELPDQGDRLAGPVAMIYALAERHTRLAEAELDALRAAARRVVRWEPEDCSWDELCPSVEPGQSMQADIEALRKLLEESE